MLLTQLLLAVLTARMREITLSEFLENHTQQEAADVIGCTQGAVWQMLKNDRDIRLCLNKRGIAVSWYEIKKPKKRVA